MIREEENFIFADGYKTGFKEGYEKALDDHRILHGEAAERLIDEVFNPKPISKEKQEFLDKCEQLYINSVKDEK